MVQVAGGNAAQKRRIILDRRRLELITRVRVCSRALRRIADQLVAAEVVAILYNHVVLLDWHFDGCRDENRIRGSLGTVLEPVTEVVAAFKRFIAAFALSFTRNAGLVDDSIAITQVGLLHVVQREATTRSHSKAD